MTKLLRQSSNFSTQTPVSLKSSWTDRWVIMSEICCWFMLMFLKRASNPQHMTLLKGRCVQLWRRRHLGWWWAFGKVTMEKSSSLCCKMLSSPVCFKPWRTLFLTSHLHQKAAVIEKNMIYLILFSWWFPGNPLMLYDHEFSHSPAISHSLVTLPGGNQSRGFWTAKREE